VFIAAKIPGLYQANEMVLCALESLVSFSCTHTSEFRQFFFTKRIRVQHGPSLDKKISRKSSLRNSVG
jgi:hypothetical protein